MAIGFSLGQDMPHSNQEHASNGHHGLGATFALGQAFEARFPVRMRHDGMIVSLQVFYNTTATAPSLETWQAQVCIHINGMYNVAVQAVDRALNPQTCTPFNLVYDNQAPEIGEADLDVLNGVNVYLVDRTLYYGPLSSGTLIVTTAATETFSTTRSGVSHVTFPALFAGGEQNDYQDPYTRTYSIEPGYGTNGLYPVEAVDRVANLASTPITVTWDATPPTVHVLLPGQAGLLFEVAWTGYDEGAGIAGFDVEYQV